MPKAKPACSGYALFSCEMRAAARSYLENELAEGDKIRSKYVTNVLAYKWKSLSEAERTVWKERAAAE